MLLPTLKDGLSIEIRPIVVKDILEASNGLPFCLFSMEKQMSVTEKMRYDINKNKEPSKIEVENKKKMMEFVLSRGIVSYGYIKRSLLTFFNKKRTSFKLNVEEYLKNDVFKDERELVFIAIITNSFKLFNMPMNISHTTVRNLYLMSTEFGKSPIELVSTQGQYNEMDAYFFNMFIAHEGGTIVNQENKAVR